MSRINSKEIILESFQYESYVLKGFLLKQQVASGWDFNSFFHSILSQCNDYKFRIKPLITLREADSINGEVYFIKDPVIKELLKVAEIPETYTPPYIVIVGGYTDLD